jgi:hypothetical protein
VLTNGGEWEWKLREVAERLRTRYEHIGRKTAAPFLSVVYPPEAEPRVLREWHTLVKTLEPELSVRTIDVLDVTAEVIQRCGLETLVETLKHPMPGSDATAELASMWISALVTSVREAEAKPNGGRPVVVLERLAALYPACGPRAVMQALWDSDHAALRGPVVFLIPGVLVEARVYRFVGRIEELMYRGDVL